MRVDKAEKTTSVSMNARVSDRDDFSNFCKDNGLVQANTLGRLVRWFMQLDPTARLLVNNKLHVNDHDAVTRLALCRILGIRPEDLDILIKESESEPGSSRPGKGTAGIDSPDDVRGEKSA